MKQRIESVDILRGFTIAAMILVNTPGTWNHVYQPLLHAKWNGLTPTDLIFPFFLFIVGISISYAYKNKKLNKNISKKIITRSLKLIGLGFFLNWFLPYFPFFSSLESVRIPGVLQRIGIIFFIVSFLFLKFNWKTLTTITILILITYWIFLGFIPLPNGDLPTFSRASNNWVLYIDSMVLKNHMWKPDYDPEGLVSTFPAIATCILGVLIGKILASSRAKKEQLLFYLSLIFLIIGYLWNIVFPINKAIWSSSFVLVTAGWALLILTSVYYVSDVRQVKFGSIFKQVSMNAITVYFLSSFVSKFFYLTKINSNENVHSWLYKHLFNFSFIDPKLSSVLYAISVMLFYLLLGHFMYKKKIFIKV